MESLEFRGNFQPCSDRPIYATVVQLHLSSPGQTYDHLVTSALCLTGLKIVWFALPPKLGQSELGLIPMCTLDEGNESS